MAVSLDELTRDPIMTEFMAPHLKLQPPLSTGLYMRPGFSVFDVFVDPLTLPLALLAQIRRKGLAEVFGLEDRPNLDHRLAWMRIGAALQPFDRLVDGFDLPQPEPGDQLLGLRERTVKNRTLMAGKPHTLAASTGVQTLARKHAARSDEFFVELTHRSQERLARHDPGFTVCGRFDQHHDFHRYLPYCKNLGIPQGTLNRAFFRLLHLMTNRTSRFRHPAAPNPAAPRFNATRPR